VWLDNIEFTNPPPGPPPALRVEPYDPWTILLSWPAPSFGYELEESTDLVNWDPLFDQPQILDGEKRIGIDPWNAPRFYRLRAELP